MSGQLATDANRASSSDTPRIAPAALAAFVNRALEAAGLSSEDAEIVAGLMVEADLRGSDTHGVIRLPLYLRRLKAGGIKARADIRIVEERAATALVDGDNGMGHLVMRFAAMTAIAKAKRAGVAWVGARMSNHAGPAALYAMMPLGHDMIGLYFAVGSNNHLPPWGSTENLLGTNPIAIAIPAEEEAPVVLDMAPTVAAFGKVRLKMQRGEPLPVGWMIGPDGKPLTDPKRAEEGLLLPIGDYKGYGLSLIVGLLAGALNQAAFGREVIDFVKEPGKAANTGHAIVALSVDAFAPAALFKRQVDAAVRTMRGAQRLPGVERIWLPGEQSHLKRQDRMQHGIPMPKPLRDSLEAASRDLGIAPLGSSVAERAPVGLIGLGLLGQAFASRLLGAGFEVMGFDLDADKTAKLAELGGGAAARAADIARACDLLVLAVFSTDQVEDVVESELLPALDDPSGKTVLCASTCDPDRIAALGQRVATRGLRLLETPVSGASGQVSRGEGIGLIGGDANVMRAVAPVLRALFASHFHIGKIGDAGRAKLAINLILGLNRLALAEGLVFAERLGLDPDLFLKVARSSAASSQVMQVKGTKMIRGEFTAEGRIAQHLKDVHLMLDQAQRLRQPLALLEIHADVLEACVRHGEGDLDNSAVIKELRRRGQA